ncbi:MFS transporter [Devosia sp. ZB163]|uniref:MFS transporter n=1 Tax=Devosia sp. ZB163 TaxID=3025938 RepID=UPI002361DDAF|nr:MFS transporter [Devosia sp. ZB163]MDC9825513.1 MFS transporter [Devosia sp. ZB163]
MTTHQSGWRDLFADGRALAVTVFAGGVGLQAIETFIGSTLLPSVVAEIGGLELFAWNTTVFIVASIIASIFAAVRPFGIGPRGSYVLAATGFAIGSLICGSASSMEMMLFGRAVQGFGAGLLTAMSYAMIRIVFPERLWGRAFALISSVWGVSTLIGPAIGGVFATFDAWRWAFWLLVPLAALLGLLAFRVIPARSNERGMTAFPIPQILLLIGAVLAVSVASILTEGVMLPTLLVGLAVLAIIALGVIDQRRENRLFPRGTFSLGSPLAALFAAMLLLNAAIVSDMFVPLFVQELHGQAPLIAGYMVALVAVGWSTGSVVTSSWTGNRARAVLVIGPVLQLVATIGLALFLGRDNTAGELLPLLPVGISLVLLGLGIGISWPHVSTRLLQAAPAGEGDLTSASISMVQLFASGLGAAVAGVIVNSAGLASAHTTVTTISASNWLYGLFLLVPLATIPIVWSIVRGDRLAGETQPAE